MATEPLPSKLLTSLGLRDQYNECGSLHICCSRLDRYMYTPTELRLLDAEYKGVSGVTLLDQGNPGPTVAIFAVTHGNEISGFDALTYLLEEIELDSHEIKGKIFLIVHNLESYRRYRYESRQRPLRDNEFRYLDINLNRIYDQTSFADERLATAYEMKRAKEISSLVPEFEYVLDLHSTSRPSDPMLIAGIGSEDQRIADQLYFYRHILDLFEQIPGKPLLDYVKKHGKKGAETVAIAVECGSHFQSMSKYCARKTSLRFLQATGVVQVMHIEAPENFKVTKYVVKKNVLPKFPDFKWAHPWSGFQAVKRGTVLAVENGDQHKADDDYVLIMPTASPRPGGDGVYLAQMLK